MLSEEEKGIHIVKTPLGLRIEKDGTLPFNYPVPHWDSVYEAKAMSALYNFILDHPALLNDIIYKLRENAQTVVDTRGEVKLWL